MFIPTRFYNCTVILTVHQKITRRRLPGVGRRPTTLTKAPLIVGVMQIARTGDKAAPGFTISGIHSIITAEYETILIADCCFDERHP